MCVNCKTVAEKLDLFMKAFADRKFWELIAEDLAHKTGLGRLSVWKKSIIENFIYDFLEDLKIVCTQNEKKAIQCNVPVIKNEFAYSQLTFSYDSFRRIFITQESNGSKTSKNMFAIYLGYDSYIDYWIKAHQSDEKEESIVEIKLVDRLSELQTLCLHRLKGEVRIDKKLLAYIHQSKQDYDIAIVELVIHLFAKHKYKKRKFLEALRVVDTKSLISDFAKRTMKILECINLLEAGNKRELVFKYSEAKSFSNISLQQSHYLAFWEGLILLGCEKYEACNAVWTSLSGYHPFTNFDNYPFVRNSRPFERALFKVMLGESNIDEIVSQLDLKEYKGLAHLSAVNCKVIRKCEYLLQNLIQMSKLRNWKNIPDFQTSWERLLVYEKLVLSNAGTLL